MSRHRIFVTLAVAGGLLRLLAMLASQPVLWFNDAFQYLDTALRLRPNELRVVGYPVFLRLLLPLHSLALVVAVQHLMGLAVAILLYLLLVRFGLPPWSAALACVPPLLDAYQIQVEHLLLSEQLFTILVVGALTALLWTPRPSWRRCAAAGGLLAAACLVRSVGVPLVLVAAGYLLLTQLGWRRWVTGTVALLAAFVLPLMGYAIWFSSAHGRLALSNSDGIFLYSRTVSYADCARLSLSDELRRLCDPRLVARRPPPEAYVWHSDSPLFMLPGPTFGAAKNEVAQRFAVEVIRQEPLRYLAVVWRDVRRSFAWHRTAFPNAETVQGYEFSPRPRHLPPAYGYPRSADLEPARRYGDLVDVNTRVNRPLARILHSYQNVIYVRGPLLAVLLAVTLVGAVVGKESGDLPNGVSRGSSRDAPYDASGGAERVDADHDRGPNGRVDPAANGGEARRRRPACLLLGMSGLALLVLPCLALEFDYRYLLPALPLLSGAATLAVPLLLERRRVSAGC